MGSAGAGYRIRTRRPDDVLELSQVLLTQQPLTRYPFRNPLPMPVERFLHADDARDAWTAEVAGRAVGHVCRVAPPRGYPEAEQMNEACARAHGCGVEDLGWVATLFVDPTVRRLGVGRALLRAAVTGIRSAGLRPCLEVLPVHAAAPAMYESAGWREVLRVRPAWLRACADDDVPDVRVLVLPDGPAVSHGMPG
jgi:GNAT superfamily N-acetyltransferase